MSDIPFIINGQDKASPAIASVDKTLAKLQQSVDKTSSITSKLAMATGALTVAYGAMKGITAALGGLSAINAAYDTQANAVRGLETALKLQGDAVEGSSAKLQSFAGDMQKLTGVGDETTLALMKQASMMGVNTDQLDDAAKAAIGLSEATGKSLDESLKLVTNSLHGEFGAFGELIPAIKTAATEEEKLAMVLALSTKGLDAKADASMTVSGMADRASGALGDLMEMVGAMIAPVRILISQGIKTLAEALQQVLAPAAEYAKSVLENIGPIMDFVKEKVVQAINGIIAAFTFVEVIVTNLGSVWELMVANASLQLERMKNVVMHVLTEVIPAYAAWFVENFVNILRDGMNLAFTVVSNHISKLVDAFTSLWDFVSSVGQTDILGQLGEIAGRSYLEGFESSLTALPEIAERQLSEKEKDLAAKVGAIGANLGNEFATKFAERMVVLDDELGKDFDKKIDLKLNEKVDDKLGKSLGGGGQQQLSASESRLLTRGPASTREDMLAKIATQIEKGNGFSQQSAAAAALAASELAQIKENTSQTTNLVPTL